MAANDFLKLARNDSAAVQVSELLEFIRDLRGVYERGTRIRAKMNHSFVSGGDEAAINWATVEALWGIPPGNLSVGTAANGKRVFTYLDGAIGSMEGLFQTNAAKELTEAVG